MTMNTIYRLTALFALTLSALGADVKFSSLPTATSPSTNSYLPIIDLNLLTAAQNEKYLLTNLARATPSGITNALGYVPVNKAGDIMTGQLQVGPSNTNGRIVIGADDPSTDWSLTAFTVDYGGGYPPDKILGVGINYAANGGKESITNAQSVMQLECDYLNSAECMFSLTTPTGFAVRPFMANLNYGTTNCDNTIRGSTYFFDENSNPIFLIDRLKAVQMYGSHFIAANAIDVNVSGDIWTRNDGSLLTTNSAGTGTYKLIKGDSSDRIVISDGGNPILIGGKILTTHVTNDTGSAVSLISTTTNTAAVTVDGMYIEPRFSPEAHASGGMQGIELNMLANKPDKPSSVVGLAVGTTSKGGAGQINDVSDIMTGSGSESANDWWQRYKQIRLRNPSYSGSTLCSYLYGLYVDPLTAGTVSYSVYTEGATPSYFGGKVTANTITIAGTTNQVVFGATNTAPVSSAAPTKWISVQVTGESTVYRLPLYE